LVRKPEGKRPLVGWEYNIKMDLKEVRSVGVDGVHLIQDRDQFKIYCKHGNEPFSSVKGLKFLY
jgi:hypothetical protein